jgi:microcystin-dependent protein
MSTYESLKYNFNGASLAGIEGIPTGTIVPWSTASTPSGYLECDGSAVSRSTYSALFAVIGTTYGVGDGSTTFNVPNLQDNVAIGKSGTKALGSTGGANTVANSGSVSTNTNTNINVAGNISGGTANATLSTSQLASHSHSKNVGSTPVNSLGNTPYGVVTVRNASFTTDNTGSGSGHSHNMSANFSGSGNAASTSSSNFTGSANSVVQPYLTVNYVIKT